MTYRLGAWKAECDRCGLVYLSDEMREEWNGLRVCRKCWSPRHPQETIQGRADHQAPPWVRPRRDVDENNTTTPDDL